MSDLIVIGYPDEETAGKVWDELVKPQDGASTRPTRQSQVTGQYRVLKRYRVKLVKVNVDDSPKLQQRFNVMAIPTLMVLRRGQVAAQRAGADPAARLRAWVEEVLGN